MKEISSDLECKELQASGVCAKRVSLERWKNSVVILMVVTGAYTCDKVSQSYASKPECI